MISDHQVVGELEESLECEIFLQQGHPELADEELLVALKRVINYYYSLMSNLPYPELEIK